VRQFEAKNRPYLQTQIGNPEGPTKPNKKYYDPREMIRAAEVTEANYEDASCKYEGVFFKVECERQETNQE